MLLRGDRIVFTGPQELQLSGLKLIAPRRPGIGANQPGNRNRRLLGQTLKQAPGVLACFRPREYRLQVATAIPNHHERDLTAGTGGYHPAAYRDTLIEVLIEISNGRKWHSVIVES